MRDNMKYIVVEYRGCELPILFDPILGHNEVVPAVAVMPVLGAGECNFPSEGHQAGGKVCVGCWGQSTSLGIKSRGVEDAKLIERMVNPYD